jgi:hypothetical protein
MVVQHVLLYVNATHSGVGGLNTNELSSDTLDGRYIKYDFGI